ncbi:hypothetical protein [Mycobacterium sp.]|uniref:hypothetical protein n=1 Tax=Mycobacterium sp. TaxID=1785 RepID=UPI0031E3ADA9
MRRPAADPIGIESPLCITVEAVPEFFEADKAVTKLVRRDAYALGDQFGKHLGGIYERFIDDIETLIVAAQQRGEVTAAQTRLVAYSRTAD